MEHLMIFLFAVVQVMSTISAENSCSSNTTCPQYYQQITVSGLPYARGLSHGIQAKDKIIANLNRYKASSSMSPWNDCEDFVNDNYIPALNLYFPNGIEEMRGIAQGANVTFTDILILNARYDLTRWKRDQGIKAKKERPAKSSAANMECTNKVKKSNEEQEECTGAVVLKSATRNKEVLLGQNWDTSEFVLNNDTAIILVVNPDPCENIKPFVTLTEAGQLVRSGFNARGFGIVAMSLWSTGDIFERNHTKYPHGWVPATILRRMFLEAPTFPLGLRAIVATPRHVSANMIIATGEDEALNIELTPDEYFISRVPLEKEILTHSNHFKSEAFLAQDDIREGSRGSSSLFRDRRVEKHLRGNYPNIDEKSFQEAFKDHVGHPNAVCEHSVPKESAWTSSHPTETTVASIIFNLSKKTMQLCKGPPCLGTFKDYAFDFSEK